jgi:putative DNA primase/helicase
LTNDNDSQPPLDLSAAERAEIGIPSERPKTRPAQRIRVADPSEDGTPLPATHSEDALALYVAAQYGEDWRYIHESEQFMHWEADGWHVDRTRKIESVCLHVTRLALQWESAAQLTADGRRKIGRKATVGAMRDILKMDQRLAILPEDLDADPMLLGVPGGVVDLRLGKLVEAERGQYITKRTAVAPERGEHPVWTQFLHTVMAGDKDKIDYLQRLAGYVLTGSTVEQCFAFLFGTGQNGKGVFMTTLLRIMGDYAVPCEADTFMASDSQRHTQELAVLRGVRLAVVDETDAAKRWNEQRIKSVTGGTPITAHRMRMDNFVFTPQFKLIVAGNHRPQIRGVGKAIQRRIHMVPFTVTIPDEERDDNLQAKLAAEYPAILQWAIDGALLWQDARLAPPETVVEAAAEYVASEDTLGEWLEACTQQTGEESGQQLYESFSKWAETEGHKAWSRRAWANAMLERGFSIRKTMGLRLYVGVSLRSGANLAPF